MKLPFKLPAFKLPSFGKKKSGKDKNPEADGPEGDDNLDLDATEASGPAAENGQSETETPVPAGDASALAALEDTMVDDSGDELGNIEPASGEAPGGKKRLIVMISGAAAGVLTLAGIVWFVFSGDGHTAADGMDASGVPRFEMDIAPKGRAPASGSLNAIAKGEKAPGAGVVIAASTAMAFANIAPPQITDGPLPDIKDPTLIEQSRQGPLPKISEDGRLPWKVYAKSYDIQDDRPKIAIIVTGLGLSQAATEAAISLLPGAVTLAFDPYAPDLTGWADKARLAGHEVMIMAPLEPLTYPIDDPGPEGLMTINAPEENLLRLDYILSRMRPYVGVISVLGSKFNQQESALEPFLKVLKDRGLMFVDGSTDQNSLAPALAEKMELPKAIADLVLDTMPTKDAIDGKLTELENIAKSRAVAVALIDAYPVSIERVAAWAAGLAKGNMELAPVSALADKQFLQ